MKMVKFFMLIVMATGVSLMGCSSGFDLNNPWANEYDVQIIGDSIFDLSGDIRSVLKDLSGKGYKDRSASGAKISGIYGQLNKALSRSSIKTIIADGGGNDVLLGSADCDSDPLTQGCLDTIDYVADTMENMLDDMYVSGLDDCVWLGYYNLPRTEAEKNEALAHCYTLYPAIFGSSAMSAYLIDPRPYISASHVKSDDIHPTYAGSVILANLIWDEMVAQNTYR
jgi:hypothetical protein